MQIGVDATCWQNTRGYGRHGRALLGALVRLDAENRYVFFMDSAESSETVPSQAELRLVGVSTPTAIAASSSGRRAIGDMWRMSRAMSASGFDLLLFPTVYSYVPVFSRAKKVVMIHDIIPERYPHLTLPSRKARLLWNTKSAMARRQADTIVTVSEYSRRCIVEHFRLSADRVHVVGEASDPAFRVVEGAEFTPRLRSLGVSADARILVYVGGFGPHKNLDTLVSILAKLVAQPEFSDVCLVMVGEYKKEVFYSHYGPIIEQIEKLGVEGRVIFTGYLPDEDLVILLNLATMLVLPSLMEGFGLPAFEAAACGCPVIATSESPLPALLGEGGVYVDPRQPQELGAALVRVLRSPELRQRMSCAGREAAGQLTWEAAAGQMLRLMHEVAAS